MSLYLGDFNPGDTVRFMWNSNDSNGASITRSTNGTISVYQNGNTTQSTTGVTDTEDFDSLTGVHLVAVDTSADGTFYAAGRDFAVVLSGATIDTRSVNAVIAHFSIQARAALRPTVATRTLDVSSTGEAGLDFDNIKAATGATTLTNITVPTVTTLTNAPSDSSGTTTLLSRLSSARAGYLDKLNDGTLVQAIWDALTSALTTSGSIGKLLVDNVNATISSRLPTSSYAAPLDASGVRTAVGLGSANLDTQLSTINTDVLTRLPTASYSAPLTASGIRAAVGLASADLDMQLSDIATQTDLIPASPAAVGSAMTLSTAAQQSVWTVNLSGVSGEARRSPLNALRKLLNKFVLSGTTWSIYKEDDLTVAYTETVTTDSSADPVTGSDPA